MMEWQKNFHSYCDSKAEKGKTSIVIWLAPVYGIYCNRYCVPTYNIEKLIHREVSSEGIFCGRTIKLRHQRFFLCMSLECLRTQALNSLLRDWFKKKNFAISWEIPKKSSSPNYVSQSIFNKNLTLRKQIARGL